MLLAMDIGNTNTVLGIFKGDRLFDQWRIRTDVNTTVDEYGITIRSLFSIHALPFEEVRHVIISCVVPPVLNAVERFCRKYLDITPLIVGPGIRTGMPHFLR